MASSHPNWQSTASLSNLQLRANVLTTIREFFAQKNILEVETPLLCQHTVTDVHIESFHTRYLFGRKEQTYYLQTSPEYAMKRLLASGSGPIYQICKSFRQGESGHRHNPEFSMLEWYRPGFNHYQLMDEVDELLQKIFQCSSSSRITYRQLFLDSVGIDPLLSERSELIGFLVNKKLMSDDQLNSLDKNNCLELILSHFIEPDLAKTTPLFVYDFPSTQAALAKIRNDTPPVAERFEAYYKGIEIANGFHELLDADEQLQRFQNDHHHRKINNLAIPKIDQRLIAALENGLPSCSGVAIGLDRIIMLLANTTKISDVVSFDWEHA